MKRIRVMIVDDSVVIRRLLTDILGADAEIEVVGVAANGKLALAKLPQLNPDLMTLDIEMPELDGLATLPLVRRDYPRLPVIMFSTLTDRGAVATLDALARGATDYVAKPANVGSVAAGMEMVRAQLIPKIKALCSPARAALPGIGERLGAAARRDLPGAERRCEAVVIGSSTGGPQALAAVLSRLPENFPAPIVVVQHMPPVFTKHLAHRLDQECALEVAEAAGNETLRPGQVLIAPGDYHLELKRVGIQVRAALGQGPAENSCRPAVDVLFRSAAAAYREGCLAVVLTGMGQDGMRGADAIVRSGGVVIAQDEATSIVWGMPRAVCEAGLAKKILPLGDIAIELRRAAARATRSLMSGGANL